MAEPYYIKDIQWQLSLFFKKVALVLSYDLCEIYKNTYHPITYQLFPITPQNQTTLLCKQISKVT